MTSQTDAILSQLSLTSPTTSAAELSVTLLAESIVFLELDTASLVSREHLLRAFLYPPEVFVYTETSDGCISIIVDSAAYLSLPQSVLDASRSPSLFWRALQINPGDVFTSDGNLIAAVTATLAKAQLSIFFISTTSDFVLVRDVDLSTTLDVLAERFNVRKEVRDPADREVDLPEIEQLVKERHVSTSSPEPHMGLHSLGSSLDEFGFTASANPSLLSEDMSLTPGQLEQAIFDASDKLTLELLADEFVLLVLSEQDEERFFKRILKFTLFPNGPQHQASAAEYSTRFYSFAHVDGELCLIMSRSTALELFAEESDSRHSSLHRPYKTFRVAGKWGFSETGLVSSIAAALSSQPSIAPTFYQSTFSTDYVFVPLECVDTALQVLAESGIAVKELASE